MCPTRARTQLSVRVRTVLYITWAFLVQRHIYAQTTLLNGQSSLNLHNQKQPYVPKESEGNAFQDRHAPSPQCDPKIEANLLSVCPDTTVEETRDLCHSNATNLNVDSIFPVTDSLSGFHFRNVHCWKCFNQSGQPLRWAVDLAVPVLREMIKDDLDIFLNFLDQNAILAQWKPPFPFTYPECAEEERTSLNCTICTPYSDSNILLGCSYVGSFKHNICFACNRQAAQYQLDEDNTCRDSHYYKMFPKYTYVATWPNSNNPDDLLIEREKSQFMRDWLSCSVDTGACVALSCQYNTFLVDGSCNRGYIWFANRFTLCQGDLFKITLENCFRKKGNGGFLSKQLRNLEIKTINITALDDLSNGLMNVHDPRWRQCRYENSARAMGMEFNELANLTTILTDHIKAFLSASKAVADFYFLNFELEERRDRDTLQLRITGWKSVVSTFAWTLEKFEKRVMSLLIKTLMDTGIESQYIICSVDESTSQKSQHIGTETCIPVHTCFEKNLEENEVSRAHLDRSQVLGNTAALVLMTTTMSLLL